jgi:hypothetical protein
MRSDDPINDADADISENERMMLEVVADHVEARLPAPSIE